MMMVRGVGGECETDLVVGDSLFDQYQWFCANRRCADKLHDQPFAWDFEPRYPCFIVAANKLGDAKHDCHGESA